MAFLNFWSAPYELEPRVSPRGPGLKESRYGSLLKFEFSEEGFGYADLHPWVEYGDAPFEAHLASLSTSSPTQLAERAMENAYFDAQARAKQKSLLAGIGKVQNNALITDASSPDLLAQVEAFENQGYTHLKMKIGRDLPQELTAISKVLESGFMKVRLDANAKLSFQQAQDFLKKLSEEERSKIEYIEDPCAFSKDHWNQLRKLVPVALDWESRAALAQGLPLAWDVLVVKPARQNLSFWINVAQKSKAMITVTSSMDHPLGVVQALVKAGELKTKFPDRALVSGCQTLQIYQETNFSQRLKNSGPFVLPQDDKDLGSGFTKLLEAMPWS